jgi:photosystem II stability/assembly factor-like uncharacterized protein
MFAGKNRWTTTGPEGASITALASDPNRSSTIYAGTPGGVFRSFDFGEHWAALEASRPLAVTAITVTPESTTLYAGTYDGEVFKSTDAGESWNALRGDFAGHGRIVSIIASAVGSNILHVAAERGIFMSSDDGASWRQVDAGLDGAARISALVSATHPDGFETPILFAATDTGLFATSTFGDGWTRLKSGFTEHIAVDRTNPAHMYIGVQRGSWYNRSYEVLRSLDGGQTWFPVFNTNNLYAIVLDPNRGSTVYLLRDGVISRSTDSGGTWLIPFARNNLWATSLLIDRANSNSMVVGTSLSGIYRSTDGLASSTEADSGLTAAPSFNVTLSDDGLTAYAATPRGLFKSEDTGVTWSLSNTGLPEVRSVSIDSRSPRTVLISGRGIAKMTRDGGETWSEILPASRPNAYRTPHFTIDPTNAANVYAAFTEGLAKSSDGGSTWSDLGSGQLPGDWYYGLFYGSDVAVDPSAPATVYAAGVRLVKSTDGGKNWAIAKNLPCGDNYVGTVAIEGTRPRTVYAACGYLLFRSDDHGEMWRAILDGIPDRAGIYDIAVDPAHGSTVFAATSAGVFISTDRGDHWLGFNVGMQKSGVYSVEIDSTGTHLVAGTPSGTYVYTRDSSYLAGAATYRVSLKTVTGNFVSASQCGGGGINADADSVGPCETFILYDVNGGALENGDAIHLQAANGAFVLAEQGGSNGCAGCVSTLNANRFLAGPWETFTIHKMNGEGPVVDSDAIALQSVYGNYVAAENGGKNGCGCTSAVTATRPAALQWETFRISMQ